MGGGWLRGGGVIKWKKIHGGETTQEEKRRACRICQAEKRPPQAETKLPSPRNKACAMGGDQLENWRHRSITGTSRDTSETKSGWRFEKVRRSQTTINLSCLLGDAHYVGQWFATGGG